MGDDWGSSQSRGAGGAGNDDGGSGRLQDEGPASGRPQGDDSGSGRAKDGNRDSGGPEGEDGLGREDVSGADNVSDGARSGEPAAGAGAAGGAGAGTGEGAGAGTGEGAGAGTGEGAGAGGKESGGGGKGANGLRVLKLKPQFEQNLRGMAVPHLGQDGVPFAVAVVLPL